MGKGFIQQSVGTVWGWLVCWLSAAGFAAVIDRDVEETKSEGSVCFLGGGWRVWGWPLLTSVKVGEVFV